MHVNLTPVEKHNGIFVKRDDLFEVAGVRGGKARSCFTLARGAKGLITAGSRQSPQVAITSAIAKNMGIPCRVHVPNGAYTDELNIAKNNGAEIIQHRPGYNSFIIKRAKDDAKAHTEFTYIPFGMECEAAVRQTMEQVQNIPKDAKRIVITVSSGMSLAGVLHGLMKYNINIPVLGIIVGADPTKRLNKYAPTCWADMVKMFKSVDEYHYSRKEVYLDNILLDPIYEAKCLPYLEPFDLFWIVGIRNL